MTPFLGPQRLSRRSARVGAAVRRAMAGAGPATASDGAATGWRLVANKLPAVIMGAIVGSWLAATVWLTVGAGDEASQRAMADLLPPVLDLAAAALVLMAATRAATPRAAAAWGIVGVSMVVYGIGDGLYAWYEIGLHVVPFPSLADGAYVAYYPVVVAALLRFPTMPAERSERLRLVIDSAIVVVGGGMVVWQSVFRPALASLDASPITSALIIGYPAGDMVLLFGIAAVALRRPAGVEPRALQALVGGLLLVLVADIGYGQLSLAGDVASQHWTDVLYMASTAAIGAAGFLQLRSRFAPTPEAPELPAPLVYLPYLALAAGYGTLLLTGLGPRSEALGELLLAAVVLSILVLLRQEFVLRQNSRLLADRARQESEARFRALAAHSTDAIVLVDGSGVVADATDAVTRVLGLDRASLIGRPILPRVHADDAARLAQLIDDAVHRRPGQQAVEWRLWDGSGGWRQVETIAANLIDDPAIGHIVLTTRDVRERKVLEQRLQQVALHDVLTGLANRVLFGDRVDRVLASGARRGDRIAVLILNINGFKRLNDRLGHAAGDRLLQELARRLQATLRAGDSCARLGGDEFAILLDGSSTAEDGRAAAERVVAALHAPFALSATPVQITVRIGIAVSDSAGEGPDGLLRSASLAMSHAGQPGRERIVLFEPQMQQDLEGRFEFEADLRRALERDELVLQYQPILDLATGDLVAAEALVRWEHPTRGRLAPNAFIPLAEETGLIDALGAWVLRTACVEVTRWAETCRSVVPRVSVNLSPHQLADPQLPWTIQAALAQAGAAPGWLALEVTENLLMENTAAILERLHAIRSLGISIAIDDFGTGYSSLAYLQHFPMSHIKIDRSFVAPLDDPALEPGVVRAVVEIGRALGMATVAEGIETMTQLERLRELGCTLGQGYLLGVPLNSDVIADRVANPVRPAWVSALSRASLPPRRGTAQAA